MKSDKNTKIVIFRSILSGGIVWVMIFSLFLILSLVPLVKDSLTAQGVTVMVLVIPFSLLAALFYYRKGAASNGLVVGIIMVLTALFLDSVITVPLLIIPAKGSYVTFYSDPLLWILIAENFLVIFLYWRLKVFPAHVSRV